MAIDFPASPSVNDTYVVGSVTYTWDGTKWTALTGSIVLDKIEEGNSSAEVIDTGSDGRFVVTTEGTERLLIDSSGRLGLGTSSPSYLLHAKTDANASTTIASTNATAGASSVARFLAISDSGNAFFGVTSSSYTDITGAQDACVINTGNASGGIVFANDGIAQVKIDSTGRLGIGTAVPGNTLDVNGIIATNSAFYTYNATNDGLGIWYNPGAAGVNQLTARLGGSDRLTIDSSGRLLVGTSTGGANLHVKSGANDGNPILRVEGSTNNNLDFSFDAIGADINVTSGDPLMFSTAGTERMRVKSNTSSMYATAYVEVNSNRTSSGLILFKVTSGATTVETGNDRFYVYGNGDVENSTGTYGQISDQKLKENIIDASSQWDDIKNLRVRNFNFRPDTNLPTHQQLGFVAQEVEAVSPGLVKTVPDLDEEGQELGTETKSVKTSIVYMKAVKALQEAMERIEQLETEMAAVKAQLS